MQGRRARLAMSRQELTLTGGDQSARRAFYDAGRRVRMLVHQRGGFVPERLDKVANGHRGVKFSDHLRVIVVPLYNAGYSPEEIHGLTQQLTHDVVDALLEHSIA